MCSLPKPRDIHWPISKGSEDQTSLSLFFLSAKCLAQGREVTKMRLISSPEFPFSQVREAPVPRPSPSPKPWDSFVLSRKFQPASALRTCLVQSSKPLHVYSPALFQQHPPKAERGEDDVLILQGRQGKVTSEEGEAGSQKTEDNPGSSL